jgi:hypothetical protein
MAKTKIGSGELSIDDELNIPGFDFDFGEPKDDRSPVEQILTGVKEGTKASFRNTGFLRRLMRASMPPVYGETENLIGLTASNASDLYNSAAREIKPAVAQLAKASESLIPPNFKKSKRAIESIKDWAEGYKAKFLKSEDKQAFRDKSIELNVGDVFANAAKNSEDQYQETKIRDTIKESLGMLKHKESQGVLGDIRHHISRLSQYNEKITQAFQKKSLELQYRSYFAQTDLVEQSHKIFELSKTSYLSIIKNTALPEYVKLRDSERFKEMAKTKVIESLFGTTSSFINKTFKNVGVKVKDYTETFKDTLSAAAMGAETASMAKEVSGLTGGSFKETLAKEGTEAAIQYAALRGGTKIREKIDSNKKLKDFFGEAQYKVSNFPELLTEYANNQNFEDSPLKAGFKNILKDFIGNQDPDSSIISDNSNGVSGIGLFSKLTNKSIIEIIPGYLARILREVQVFRTGDENISLTVYDPYSNKFKDQKTLKNSILSKLFPEASIRSQEETRKDIFDLIDPESKLSEEQRTALLDKLTKDKYKRKNLSPENLSKAYNYKKDENLKDSADQIAEVFRDYFTDGGKIEKDSSEFKDRRNKLSRVTGRIGRFFNNPASEIQNLINMGYYDELRDLGLVNESGSSVNFEEVLKKHSKLTTVDDTQTFRPTNNVSTPKNTILESIRKPTSEQGSQVRQRNINISAIDQEKLNSTLVAISDKLVENSSILKDFLNLSKDNQTKFDSFVRDNVSNLNGIENTSSREEIVKTNEILTRIEEFIVGKLPELIQSSSSGNSFNDPENQGYRRDTLFGNIRGVADKTIGSAWRGIFKPLNKKILKGAWGFGKLSKNSLGWSLNKGRTATNFLSNQLVKLRDIYVSGEEDPRLTAAGLKTGIYVDSVTGKVIKTFYDLKKLKGNIVDNEGNVVLKPEELKQAFVKRIEGTGIFSIGKWVGERAMDFSKFSTRQFFNGLGAIGSVMKMAKRAFSFTLDHPTDIYLKGISTPIMLAIIMKNGGYISAKTKQPIMKPSEIDGPVLDSEGNYVLTAEQLKQGLVDKFGKPITTPLMKLLGLGVGVVKKGISAALSIGKFGTNMIKNGLGRAGDFMQGVLDVFSTGIGGKQNTDTLIQIRDILDSRLPKTKNVFGDSDGDGDRENSWQDMLTRKSSKGSKDKEDRKDSTVKPDRQNVFDKIAETAGSIKDKILGALGLGEDGVNIDINTDGESSEKSSRRSRAGKKGGLFRKGGRMLGNVAGGALGAAGWLGRGLLTAGAAALPMIGTAIGATASTIGAAVAGIGSVVSLPVVLTVAGIAALGYGGYKTYNYFNNKRTNLIKMRMAQYGLSIDEASHYSKIEELESRLIKHVSYDETNANFDVDDVLVTELLKVFGVDPENSDLINLSKIEKWTHWFINRFKPVYLVHMTALNKLGSKLGLESVDKLDSETKIKYITAVTFPEGPYKDITSPIPELENLQAGIDLVNYYSKEALKEANEEKNKVKKTTTSNGIISSAVAATTTVGADNSNSKTNDKPPESVGILGKLKQTLVNMGSFKASMILASPFAALGAFASRVIGQSLGAKLGFGVNALEAVRLKTYGLKTLDRSKVSSIRNLENVVLDYVTFDSQGRAYFNESPDEILNKVSSDFGISQQGSPNTKNFLLWFQHRFLPTYLNYLGLVKQVIGGAKPTRDDVGLSEQARLDVAKKVAATMGVWSANYLPWENEEINMDESSVKENISFLESKAKDAKLKEEKSPVAKTIAASIVEAKATKIASDQNSNKSIDKFGFSGRFTGKASNETQGVVQAVPIANNDLQFNAKNIEQNNRVNNNKKSSKSFSGFGDEIDGYVSEAAKKYGMDEKVLRGFVKMEAGWKGQMSPTGAIGVGQFTKGTWDALAKTPEGKEIGMTEIGDRFRTPQDPRHDKKINTLATALLAKKNSEILVKNGLEVSGENLYMMHNIGPGFIKAVKTGEASPATMKAMQLNGMKPGMTPATFVDYQKGRFNNHYNDANGGIITADYRDRSRSVATVPNSREAINNFRSNSVVENNSRSVMPVDPGIRTPDTGYSSSVRKTGPHDSIANGPNYRDIPQDDFSSIMRRNREIASRADRRTNVDPNTVLNNQINNGIGGLTTIASEHLDVSKQMLQTLNTIKDKMPERMQKEEKPKTIPEPEVLRVESKTQQPRKVDKLPRSPVVLTRS